MSNSGREKLNRERLLKDYHLTRKILFLFLPLLLSIMTFGLYEGSNELNACQDNELLCVMFLLFFIVALTIFIFYSVVQTFNIYFDIKDKKYIVVRTFVCDKSIYHKGNCDMWIKTELNKEERLKIDKKIYKEIHRDDTIYIVYLNSNIIGIYPKQNYYLDYEEFVKNSKKMR